MKAVKRGLVIDPDTGDRSVRREFDVTQPWDEATVALFRESLDAGKYPPALPRDTYNTRCTMLVGWNCGR